MYNLPTINTSLSKTDLKVIAEAFISQVEESGKGIESAELLSKMEYLIKEIRANKEFIEFIRDEIAKNGSNVTTSTGTKIELSEAGVRYDYSNCGDKIWNGLIADKEYIESKIKEREAFLKALPYEGLDTFDENGEVFKLYPPSKSSTRTFKTTLAK